MNHKTFAFYLTLCALVIIGLLYLVITQSPFRAFDSNFGLSVGEKPPIQEYTKIGMEIIGQSSSTIYVDCQSGNDNNDGSFWNRAKKTLASAVNSAGALTDIFLKANDGCHYQGGIDTNKPLIISGGYTGSLQNPHERFMDKNSVISSNNNNYVFRIQSLNGKFVFDRVTIKDGNNPVGFGGGIYVSNSPQAEFTIQNSLVENNFAKSGGGIYASGLRSFIVNQTSFRNNRAGEKGGAISIYNTHKVINCNFTANSALMGGAINIEGGNHQTDIIAGNNFISNIATGSAVAQGGGAIYARFNTAPIVGNFFRNNQGNYGSAVVGAGGSNSAYFVNNIFVGNIANYATMYIGAGHSYTKSYGNIFAHNTAALGPTTLMVGEGTAQFTLQNSVIVDYDKTRPLIGKDSNQASSFTYNYVNIFPSRTNQEISNPPQQVPTKIFSDPKFLSTSYPDDPFSFEFQPSYEGIDYGYQNNPYFDFRGCPRDVKGNASSNNIYPDMSAFEYQAVSQNVLMPNWRGPRRDGDQSTVQLTVTVKDVHNNVLLPPTNRSQSPTGYYTIPTRYLAIPAGTVVRTIIKAPGHLAKAIQKALPACNSPGQDIELIMGDVNGDNLIGLADVSAILVNFAKTGALGALPEDLDGDGVVTISDLNSSLTNFAKIGDS